MKPPRFILLTFFMGLLLVACDSATPDIATPVARVSATRAPTSQASTAVPTSIITPVTSAATRIATPTASPTPAEPSGTASKDDGQNLMLSHPQFYWALKLPRDWLITYDMGFEVKANNPQKTAFIHLMSQIWETDAERLPNARAYVDYWKHFVLGDVFPVYAEGTQVSETELSKNKFGGPYLRYEFNDGKKGTRFLQVYASGGGPNSLVVTLWAKDADYNTVKASMESILNSIELIKETP